MTSNSFEQGFTMLVGDPPRPDQLVLEVSPLLRVIAQTGGEVVDADLDRYHSGAVVADGGGRVQVRAL